MFISEDGTVTGSINVDRLGEVKPKTDEAKSEFESLLRGLGLGEDDGKDKPDKSAKPADQTPEGTDDSDLDALRADAEAAGVKVDKRWGADRLQEEIASAGKGKGKG